jgi:hypothetical protein
MKKTIAVALLAASSLAAQGIQWPASFAQLAERADESVEVNIDAAMLGIASGILSSQDADEAKVKGLVQGLKGIYVRSFEFSKEGMYNAKDVEDIRNQLTRQGWSSMVNVRESSGENTGIFLKKEGDQIVGLTVVAAEPTELTVVHIDGPINLNDLAKLGGSFGIPKMSLDNAGPGATNAAPRGKANQ